MKLNFQQKIALIISVLWCGVFFMGLLIEHSVDSLKVAGVAMLPALFLLWITGTLPILIKWLKG